MLSLLSLIVDLCGNHSSTIIQKKLELATREGQLCICSSHDLTFLLQLKCNKNIESNDLKFLRLF